MKNRHLITGKVGEVKVLEYLRKLGYAIIETNYQNKIGEIDIICKDKEYIVMVEVKSRMSLKYGRPGETVGYFKQNKIRNTATCYLVKEKLYPCPVRFDVIEILDNEILSHIKNAF